MADVTDATSHEICIATAERLLFAATERLDSGAYSPAHVTSVARGWIELGVAKAQLGIDVPESKSWLEMQPGRDALDALQPAEVDRP